MCKDEIPVGKAEDLRGQKFNKLTVLYRVANQNRRTMWKCKCECGNVTIIRGDSLKSGHTTSCGCNYSPDLIGNRYGKLIVLQKYQTVNRELYWTCKCDCGNIVNIRGISLTRGDTKSCGCLRREIISELKTIDLVGKKFGKLTVIKDSGERSNYKSIIWLCKCDCGNVCKVDGANLRSGHTQSCGCLLSQGELKIISLLQENNINFTTQKTFDNCFYFDSSRPPRFDFYIDDEYLIEYDGQQHYFPIELFGGDEQFIVQQERDEYKNQWCKNNNIPLIRIPYTKLDTLCIEDLMLETTQFRAV